MALVALAGTVLCPLAFPPHAITVPSARNPKLWNSPAAIAVGSVNVPGTLIWPEELSPQPTTTPSFRKANECAPPAAMLNASPQVFAAAAPGSTNGARHSFVNTEPPSSTINGGVLP